MSIVKERADALYSYLINNQDRYVSQEELCAVFPNLFPYIPNNKGTTANRNIWDAVQLINDSIDEYTLIVVTKRRSYKLATKEDANKYLAREFKNLGKKAKRLHHIKRKMQKDGTADLTSLLSGDTLEFLNTLVKSEEFNKPKTDEKPLIKVIEKNDRLVFRHFITSATVTTESGKKIEMEFCRPTNQLGFMVEIDGYIYSLDLNNFVDQAVNKHLEKLQEKEREKTE